MTFIAGLTESSKSDEDSVKTLLLASGEKTVHRAVWEKISGRKYMPGGPDNLLPGPLCHPRVRPRLAPNHRSQAHFRPGHHGCGQAL